MLPWGDVALPLPMHPNTMTQEQTFRILTDDQDIPLTYTYKRANAITELYDWQNRAVKFFFQSGCNALLEVCTGVGKTYCAIEIMKQVFNKDPTIRVLIIVPKNVILEDTWLKELYNAGFPMTTVGVFYGFAKEEAKITITNMQNAAKIDYGKYAMILMDECHNYPVGTMKDILNHEFKYRVGLSATLSRTDNKHLDVLKAFNYNVFMYNANSALQDKILNNFYFYNIIITLDEDTQKKYDELTKQLTFLIMQAGGVDVIIKRMSANNPIKANYLKLFTERRQLVLNYPRKFDAAKMIYQRHPKDKIIIFNEFNDQTNKLYWYLLDVDAKAKCVHSGIEHDERDKILQDYRKGTFNVLCTTRILDEGYNLPAIETAIIMAGNATAKQTIQRLGRVLRKKDTPSKLYQVYCANTMEEKHAAVRTRLFKDLCEGYEEVQL